jgi:hypothetical protein
VPVCWYTEGVWQPRRSALRAASLTALCLAAAPPALAEDVAPDRLRAIVRVASAADRGFLARVRGQTSDLPVDLIEAPAASLEPTLDQQVAAAEALARARHARAVFWLGPDQVLAYIGSAPGSAAPPRLLTRQGWTGPAPAPAPSPSPSSADLEAAALIARSALKAVLEGHEVGEPRPPPPPPPIATPPPPATAPPPAPPRPVEGWIALGWIAAADGVGSDPTGGFTARAGARLDRFAVGAGFSRMLGKDVPRASSPDAQHRRQAIVALVAMDVLRRSRIRLAAELEAGYERFWLTETINPNATPPTLEQRRFMMGAELRGAVAVWARRHAAIELTLGVGSDYVPSPPSIVTKSDNGTVINTIWRLWRFQPRGILGVEVTLR